MKKKTLLLAATLLYLTSLAQDAMKDPVKQGKRFYAGLSYSYLSVDMKLQSLSLNSVWYGSDQGTNDLSDGEIDTINNYVDRTSHYNALGIEAGMWFIDRPDLKWKMAGNLFLGIAGNVTTVYNKTSGIEEYSFNSGFSKPCAGIDLNFGYQFNKYWGLWLRPGVTGIMGKITDISDRSNAEPDSLNFNRSKEDNFHTVYLRGSLMGSYTIGPVTIFAGPGYYQVWTRHDYKRTYTQYGTGDIIQEKATSVIIPDYHIDVSLAVSWRIIETLTFHANAGIGNDLMIHAGLDFNF